MGLDSNGTLPSTASPVALSSNFYVGCYATKKRLELLHADLDSESGMSAPYLSADLEHLSMQVSGEFEVNDLRSWTSKQSSKSLVAPR